MIDFALLLIRLTIGSLLAGHGAQKLYGWFEGFGLEGTAGWMESLGFRPGKRWAALAGISEFGGGVLTALGFAHPVGPVMTLGAMGMAQLTVHAGKPIWVTSGGGELVVTNMVAASALALAGPGKFSLDRLFGFRVPGAIAVLTLFATLGGIVFGLGTRQQPPQAQQTGAVGGQAQEQQVEPTPDDNVTPIHEEQSAA